MARSVEEELKIACTVVQHCAVLTQRLQRKTLKQASSISKSDFSPVTVGDFAVQALLTSAIRGEFPNDTFLAEESADQLRENRPLLDQVWTLIESIGPAFASSTPSLKTPATKSEVLQLLDLGGKNNISDGTRNWVFDPIDGTATFMKGQQYAINCAFLVDGIEQLGIIGCPNVSFESLNIKEDDVDKEGLGIQLYAVRGSGTFLRPMQDSVDLVTPTKIERHGEKADLQGLVWSDSSTYTSTIQDLHQRVAIKLGAPWPGVDLFSSLMKYAALGLGRSSIVIRIFKRAEWRSNMWDHAGGVLIFEEAGGKVTDLNGNAIDFSKGRKMSENCGLVCAPSSVHAEVLQIIREVIRSHGPSEFMQALYMK